MTKEQKKAMEIVNRFYRIENGYQWCEAKKEALICIDILMNEMYENFYDISDSYDFYLKVKKEIQKI
jgi:hypothetical protein